MCWNLAPREVVVRRVSEPSISGMVDPGHFNVVVEQHLLKSCHLTVLESQSSGN